MKRRTNSRVLRNVLVSSVLSALILATLTIPGCGGGSSNGTPPPPTVSVVSVSLSPASIQVGATSQAGAQVHWSDGSTHGSVAWSSDNTAVATVDSSGVVTGVKAGTANVKATSANDSTKSGSAQITVTKTVSSVTLVCSPLSIPVGGTSACTPAVTYGDGTTDASVTIASDNSSVATVSGTTISGISAGTANITATANLDGKTKSSPQQITVLVPAPHISAITPFVAWQNYVLASNKYVVTGQNFLTTDRLTLGHGLGGASLATYVDSAEIDINAVWDTPSYDPGQNRLTITRADDSLASNTFVFAMLSNRNMMVQDPKSGDLFQFEAGAYKIYHFKSDGTSVGNFSAGYYGIAFDDATGTLVLSQDNGALAFYKPDGTIIGGNVVGWVPTDVDAKSGIACGAQPSGNSVVCMNTSNFTYATSPTVFNAPNAIKMGMVDAELDAFVFSTGNNMLTRMNVSTMQVVGNPLQLTGITQTAPNSSAVQVVYFPAVETVIVLSPADNLVVLVDAATMNVKQMVSLSGTVYSGFADQINGKLIVVYNPIAVNVSGTEAVPVNLLAMDVSNGTITALATPPADLLPTGGTVSLDGKAVILGDRNRVFLFANQ